MSSEGGESSSEPLFPVQKDLGRELPSLGSQFKCRELGLGWHQQVSKKVNCSSHSWEREETKRFREIPCGHQSHQLFRERTCHEDRKMQSEGATSLPRSETTIPTSSGSSVGRAFWNRSNVGKTPGKVWQCSPLPAPFLLLHLSTGLRIWISLQNYGSCCFASDLHSASGSCSLVCPKLGRFILAEQPILSAITAEGRFWGSQRTLQRWPYLLFTHLWNGIGKPIQDFNP